MNIKKEHLVSEFNSELKLKGFNVFEIDKDSYATKIYSRKDFYKICLTTGKSIIHYADRSFEHEGTILFFGNPHIPYSWESYCRKYTGYTCLFSEEFFKQCNQSDILQKSPLFQLGGTPILKITDTQRAFLNEIFCKMIENQQSNYSYRDELIRNYIHLIFHEALKMQPSEKYDAYKNSASRLTLVFFELLERQFPIESLDLPLRLKTAQDYASNLSVHVNYLNRVVKEITGKPTTVHITNRVVKEAEALLRNTNWSISDIAYALGFEYTTYFSNFIKNATGKTPKTIRATDI
ncbi:helix-turn-helix domain-containing protein [Chondrinema litorale]|uniref:helix-turn-helix domain-containing protein n=1 Tax=Chondrinema litorale TaxID=2994555 RepID=UPI0025434621|nr:helix-turn-helix domain-containing protein [Chondrinema litorale]UZR96825.1 helix-turn-helix domain-containing protein [Chondrinema litorale]